MMQFHSFAEFIAMGGYGFYVWLAYGISGLLIGGYFVGLRRQRLAIERQVKRLVAREAEPSGVEA